MEYIITFKNTNSAIKSEQALLAEKLHVSVMPLPSQIRAGCGICLRLPPDEIRPAVDILTDNLIGDAGLFMRTGTDHKWIYSEVTDRSAL
jgi:hypothetical protein